MGFRVAWPAFLIAGCNLAQSPAQAADPFGLAHADPQLERGARSERSHPGQNGGLSALQMDMARTAWRYFENNFQPSTCLYNSVDSYPSTTMWDLGSSIAALVSAYELGIIHVETFDERMRCLLASLDRLELYRGELPNIAYNTQTLAMVDYNNNPGELGFSAIDLGRLLLWLDIVKQRYPRYGDDIDRFVLSWQFCNVLDRCGHMYGAVNPTDGDDSPRYLQEGRLGYEEYAAAGYGRWGFATPAASAMEPYNEIGIFGVPIAYDERDPAKYGAHNYVVMESYLLAGMELNWDLATDTSRQDRRHTDPFVARQAQRVYRAQARRYELTGILTARTEHQLDQPPWFIYDTVYSDGVPWNTIASDGTPHPELAAFSTKAAMGMWILFDNRYGRRLEEAIWGLYDTEKGFYEGYYEADGRKIETFTANTNGIILEALLYREQGKLLRVTDPPSLWNEVPNDEFPGKLQCLPCGLAGH
jgi:hypothetical protein